MTILSRTPALLATHLVIVIIIVELVKVIELITILFCFHFQKRPCLDYSSCHSDNTSNFETENRLFQNMHTSHTMPHSQLLTEQYSCTTLDADTDGKCNAVKQDEEMDVSCCFESEDRQGPLQPEQSTFVVRK